MVKVRLEPVRGMRDILEPESNRIKLMFNLFSEVAESYGYEYVITPTLEYFELLAAKSGPEISRSMYVFKDKAGRAVCLRPEFTASIARVFLKYLRARPKPVKLYYVGPVFRYEEPQFGRYREFFQAGTEYLGDSSTYADIEQLLIIRDYYGELGLKDYVVKVGSVGIVRRLLTIWGVDEETQDIIIHYIDKKMWEEVLRVLKRYNKADIGVIEGLINSRVKDYRELDEVSSEIGLSKLGDDIISNELARLKEIASAAKELGINMYIDLSFARGLAYYTGFIFEVEVPDLPFSIAGGGRYDNLISVYGGPNTPATGFSVGIDRSYIALIKQGIDLDSRVARVKVMLIATKDVSTSYIDEVASMLRRKLYVVNVRIVKPKKIADVIGLASRLNYDYVIIIGTKEYKKGKVTVKNLVKRTQVSVDKDVIREGLPT